MLCEQKNLSGNESESNIKIHFNFLDKCKLKFLHVCKCYLESIHNDLDLGLDFRRVYGKLKCSFQFLKVNYACNLHGVHFGVSKYVLHVYLNA